MNLNLDPSNQAQEVLFGRRIIKATYSSSNILQQYFTLQSGLSETFELLLVPKLIFDMNIKTIRAKVDI